MIAPVTAWQLAEWQGAMIRVIDGCRRLTQGQLAARLAGDIPRHAVRQVLSSLVADGRVTEVIVDPNDSAVWFGLTHAGYRWLLADEDQDS